MTESSNLRRQYCQNHNEITWVFNSC